MYSLRPLFASVRTPFGVLLATADEPAAELLAMVWGPRFDRDHARQLLQSVAHEHPAWERALVLAALTARETFDIVLDGALESEDTVVMIESLRRTGLRKQPGNAS